MNTDTGKVYTGEAEIAAAKARGENLVPIVERAAKTIKAGRKALAAQVRARRIYATKMRERSKRRRSRARDKIQKASRKANR